MTTTPTAPAVHLRPIEPGDYGPLRRVELDLTLGPRWRHRGATPSPEEFARSLWAGVLCQYLVLGPEGREPLGIVTAYGADLQSGTAWVAFARFPTSAHPARFLVGVRRFVDHLFATWPLRKLCAEVLEPNLAAFESVVDRLFVREGCHRDHAFLDGRHVDQHLFALWRERWVGGLVLRSAEPAPGAVPTLAGFHRDLATSMVRAVDDLDPDLPLLDQDLDSLDWLVVADHLEQYGIDLDETVDLLDQHLTLRSLHARLVELVLADPDPGEGSGSQAR